MALAMAPWVLFTGLGLLQTHNAFFSSVAVILGGADQPDWTGTMWTYWWTWTALMSGESPFVASANLFPIGLSPVAQYNLLDALLLGWLIPAIGPTRGYNLAGLAVLVIAGGTGMAMSRRLGAGRWAAVGAGLLLQTSAMMVVEVTGGRLSQAFVPFAGLAFVGLLRITGEDAGRRHAVRAGLLTAATALVYWYAALFVALGAVPAAIAGWRRWKALGVAVVVCVVLCLPAVLALVSVGADLAGVDRTPVSWMADDSWTFGRYGLGMALSQAYLPTWPVWTPEGAFLDKRLSPLLLLLAGLGAVAGPRRWRLPLVGGAVVGWLMTLGPWLKNLSGDPLPIPLPWLALEAVVPFFDRLWWPGRFELVVVLSLVPLAAFGLQALARRWSARGVAVVFSVAFVAELVAWSPYHPLPASPPRPFDGELYAAIDGPFVSAPIMPPQPDVRFVQWVQVVHEQPITGGLGEHLPGHMPQAWMEYVERNQLLDVLRDSNAEATTRRVVTPADVDALLDDGLRWIVVDTAVLPKSKASVWLQRHRVLLAEVWGQPDVETAGGAAWRIRPIPKPLSLPDLGEPPSLAPPDAFSRGKHRGERRKR